MPKVILMTDDEKEQCWRFYCPGCQCSHWFRTRRSDPSSPLWTWNGDVEKPTVQPSIDVSRSYPKLHCHLFIRDGVIEYLTDCYHHLKGQKVPMEEDD